MASNGGDEIFTMCLLGETGSGKSSLANFILGESKFESGHSLFSVTRAVGVHVGHYLGSKREVRMVDCPGLNDPQLNEEGINRIIKSIRKLVAVNVFLIVVNGTQCRLTASLQTILHIFRGSFGLDFFQNAVYVFTHMDPECMKHDSDVFIRVIDLNKAMREEFQMNSWLNVFCVDTVIQKYREASKTELWNLMEQVKDYDVYCLVDVDSLKQRVKDFREKVEGLKTVSDDFRVQLDKCKRRISGSNGYYSDGADVDNLVDRILDFNSMCGSPRPPKTLFGKAEEMENVKESITVQTHSLKLTGFWSFMGDAARALLKRSLGMLQSIEATPDTLDYNSLLKNFLLIITDILSQYEVSLVVTSPRSGGKHS